MFSQIQLLTLSVHGSPVLVLTTNSMLLLTVRML